MKKVVRNILIAVLAITVIISLIGVFNSKSIQDGGLVLSQKWEGSFLNVNGDKIRYLQKGSGPNILFIHGTPGSIEDWQSMIDGLSENFKVTAYDRYGNGFSTANNYNYTLDENVALASHVIEALDLDSVVVVGHSYGGSTTTQLATLENNRIKSFVVVAAPLYDFDLEFNYKLIAAPLIGKGIAIIASKSFASILIKSGLAVTFGPNQHLLTEEFVGTRTRLWSQSKVLYGTSNERKNYGKALRNNASGYKSIKKKISFLVGANDAPDIVRDFYQIKKDLPTAGFTFLENTAHFIQFEKPEVLKEVILSHHK